MLPNPTVPPSLLKLLNHFWPCFTRPTFAVFAALVTGLIAHTGTRTVCGMLTGAGLARTWPHDRAHAFFAQRRWSPDRLGETAARLVVRTCTAPGEALTLAVDDTLVKRSGSTVSARLRQHDGAAPGPRKLGWGVCFVVTALAVRAGGRNRALALPTLARCWRPAPAPAPRLSACARTACALERARHRYDQARRGLHMRLEAEAALPRGHRLPGTDPKPALHRRVAAQERALAGARADHEAALEGVLEPAGDSHRPTKTETAIALGARQARLFPDRMIHVVADAAYHSPALRALPPNMTWTFRLMSSAVLDGPAPPAAPGTPTRPGRPAISGARLGTPAHIAGRAAFTPTRVPGRSIAAIECRWARSLGRTPVRLLLVRHDAGTRALDLALLTTDVTSPAEQVVDRYADRWPIETCFQDTRAHLGLEQARNRTRAAVERTVPLQLLSYSLVVLWYHRHGDAVADVAARRRAHPWYASKTAPAFADMLAALQREIIDHRISARVGDLRVVRLIREIVYDLPAIAA
ncbi:hypothetical protein GCM10027570_15780 [Streptomonospora sediminis]